MSRIFEDNSKIKQFEQIQKNLSSLMPNSADDAIQSLLSQIPEELLATKEDLMIICELFAIYARNKHKTKKRNVFKLFEGIMTQIKAQLNDESSFFLEYFWWTLLLQTMVLSTGSNNNRYDYSGCNKRSKSRCC